jgi:hypothetical protein
MLFLIISMCVVYVMFDFDTIRSVSVGSYKSGNYALKNLAL